jgi:5-methylcytosine-specific restriction protein A
LSTIDKDILHQQQIEEMKQAFFKERQEMIEGFNKILEKHATHSRTIRNDHSTLNPVPKRRGKISKEARQKIADKQNNVCGECKLALTPYFQVDHTIGLQFGGTDDESNLMALCCECHAIKSIGENQCRKRIQEAIHTILKENLSIDRDEV